MKASIFIIGMGCLCLCCRSKEKLKDVFISPSVYTIEDTLFLKWNFRNATDSNFVIPTLFTFRRLDGEDRNTYSNKENDLIEIGKMLIVPYKYLKQVPDFESDTSLHLQAFGLNAIAMGSAASPTLFMYITALDKCPMFIFLKAHSEKQLLFMFKPEVKGRYMIGFETKKSIDRTSLRVRGDSIVKRGVPLLQEIIGNRVEGYSFDYGEFKIDSLEVNL